MTRRAWAILAVCALAAGVARAADSGATRLWNLTGETITQLHLAPAGTTAWGADQCPNDPDGRVDFDERLRITGVTSGRYDVRFTDTTGRSCVVKGVAVTAGKVFSIGKEQLTECSHR